LGLVGVEEVDGVGADVRTRRTANEVVGVRHRLAYETYVDEAAKELAVRIQVGRLVKVRLSCRRFVAGVEPAGLSVSSYPLVAGPLSEAAGPLSAAARSLA
jgi:hypothetical protein